MVAWNAALSYGEGMETLRHIVLFVHLIGFAVLFGAWAAQAFGGKRVFTRLMTIGMTISWSSIMF